MLRNILHEKRSPRSDFRTRDRQGLCSALLARRRPACCGCFMCFDALCPHGNPLPISCHSASDVTVSLPTGLRLARDKATARCRRCDAHASVRCSCRAAKHGGSMIMRTLLERIPRLSGLTVHEFTKLNEHGACGSPDPVLRRTRTAVPGVRPAIGDGPCAQYLRQSPALMVGPQAHLDDTATPRARGVPGVPGAECAGPKQLMDL